MAETASPYLNRRTASLRRARSYSGSGDRFIPTRHNMDMDLAHFQMLKLQDTAAPSSPSPVSSPVVSRRSRGSTFSEGSILNFHDVKLQSKGGDKTVFSQDSPMKGRELFLKSKRSFTERPDIVMNLSGFQHCNGFHEVKNNVDINCHDFYAVGHHDSIILESIYDTSLPTYEMEIQDCCRSLSWNQDGDGLGYGTSLGKIKVLDTKCCEVNLSTNVTPKDFVTTMSFGRHTICGGTKHGHVNVYDIRHPGVEAQSLCGHTALGKKQAAINLVKYSPDYVHIACGDTSGMVTVWDCRNIKHPVMKKKVNRDFSSEHGVRALAWSPCQPNLLATGIGSEKSQCRGLIVTWKIAMALQNERIITDSLIETLDWSKVNNELISGHGEPEKNIQIWRCPDMEKIAEIKGHPEGLTKVTVSPDGEDYIYAFTRDEYLRAWKYPPALRKPRSGSHTGARGCLTPAKLRSSLSLDGSVR
ncbi:cell division cycle protein 20 homolog [Glandiceps talaboti]